MGTDEPVDPAEIIPPSEAGDYATDRAACAAVVGGFIDSIDDDGEETDA